MTKAISGKSLAALLLGGALATLMASAQAQDGAPADYRLMLGFTTVPTSTQQQIYTQNNAALPPGAPAAAGLAGALVGALITRTINGNVAEQARQRNQLGDQALDLLQADFPDLLRAELQATVPEQRTAIELVGDPLDLDQPGLLRRIGEPAIVTSEVLCRFEEKLRRLKLYLTLKVWRKGSLMPVRSLAIEHQSEELDDSEPLFERWSRDDARLLRSAVSAGAKELSRKLVAEMQETVALARAPQ